jgi:hypothetical protein
MNQNNPLNPLTNQTLAHGKMCEDIGIYYNIHIQSSDSSLSNPSNPHLTPATIAFPQSSSSHSSPTLFYNQTTSSLFPSYSSKPIYSLYPLLENFLYSDITSDRPEFEKWVEWSKERGYKSSRIVDFKDGLYLISEGSGKEDGGKGEGHWDIYKLPYHHGRGGIGKPVLSDTYTSRQIHKFKMMLVCKNVSRYGYDYCGFCPRCLAYKSNNKLFAKKASEIQKLEGDIEDLKKLEKGNAYISSRKRWQGYLEDVLLKGKKAKKFRKRTKVLERWASNPKKYILHAEKRLLKLQQAAKVLEENVKLSLEPHYFISVCTPASLHVLYNVQEAWFTPNEVEAGKKSSDALKRILKGLKGKGGGFSDTLRCVFRDLVVEAVKEAVKERYPEVELSMEHQLHPCNKWDMAPDIHFLIRRTVLDKGVVRELPFDADVLRKAVEGKMKLFVKVARRIIKSWKGKCRATAFQKWKKDVREAEKTINETGILAETVDIQVREPRQLLSTHRYLRRYPMENIYSMYFKKEEGKVHVTYWDKDGENDKAEHGVLDFLWRLVGFDGRKFGVKYNGDYSSSKVMKRFEKMEAHEDACGKSITDSTDAMGQEMIDRHATIDGGLLEKIRKLLPADNSHVSNIKDVM